jgi:hypothetical protein
MGLPRKNKKCGIILQSWCVLILRRRAKSLEDKDAVYDKIVNLAHGSASERVRQQKTRLRRSACALVYVLIDYEEHGTNSLLVEYMSEFHFPWSAIYNLTEDQIQPRRI